MAGMQGELKRAAAPVDTTTRCANFEAAKRYRDQAALFMVQGRFAEAETCSRAALGLWPDDVDTLNELGVAVWRQGRLAEAEAIYIQACQIEPNNSRILNNLGLALSNQGRMDEAGDCYRRILRFEPEAVGAMMNLGISLMHAGEYDEALDLLRAAHKLRPNSVDILHNLGTNLARQGRLHEAIDCYEQALRQSPVCPEVHRNLAYALLSCGDYARGWPEHEWRLLCKDCAGYKVNRAFWNGDNLEGRTILLHGEQGHGDALQFIRFAPMVKERMGRVLVVCPPPLLQLVARCKGVDMAFASGSYEPKCHVHAPLLSLPAIFGTTLETLPAQVPYLVTDKVLVDHWRVEIAKAIDHDQSKVREVAEGNGSGDPSKPLLVGIAWQGNPTHSTDRWRSFPLAKLAPLAEVPGVRLISLQAEHGLDQLRAADRRFPVIELPGRRCRDFMETAAIMTHLDLVVTADTAVAHLAGALGLRVWTGLCTINEWRWLAGRDDSPWYPTMRLFRQTSLGDWDGVFRRMTEALQ